MYTHPAANDAAAAVPHHQLPRLSDFSKMWATSKCSALIYSPQALSRRSRNWNPHDLLIRNHKMNSFNSLKRLRLMILLQWKGKRLHFHLTNSLPVCIMFSFYFSTLYPFQFYFRTHISLRTYSRVCVHRFPFIGMHFTGYWNVASP